MPQLNWSHFKPEFAGKAYEDAEAHLLRTNDWMDTSAFQGSVKFQRFDVTLISMASLWYESLRPIALDWNGLQNHIWKQFSKIVNTNEQLFHVQGSFHFDENTAYVTCIRQIAALLGYGKPQTLEVFKNTLPMRLYWVLFPRDDLRLAVETANKILTKEKIDRQLADQSSSTPFMDIRDG